MLVLTSRRLAMASGFVFAAFGTLPGSAQPAPQPTDAQIAHVAYTAGEIDIKNAKLAQEKTRSKDVRAFADDMVRDHAAINDRALSLVRRLKVTPEENPTSQSLVKQQDAERAKLAALNGPAFDKAYVANEAAYHAAVNGALQNTLTGCGKSDDWRVSA